MTGSELKSCASGIVLLVLVATARASAAQHLNSPASELTRASAARLTTAELARRLLPPELAGRMVSHKLGQPIFPSGPIHDVSFYTRPVPLGQDLCHRESFFVHVEPIGGLTRENSTRDVPVEVKEILPPKVQLAAAPECRLNGGFFTSGSPPQAVADLVAALRRLISLQKAARVSGSLPAEISCRIETPENPCASGARAVFAGLPLHRIFIVRPAGQAWEFSVHPDDAGQRLWSVKLHKDGAQQRVELVWGVPPPF